MNRGHMVAMVDAEAEEIRHLARRYQYDRYIAATLMARRDRDALIVLAAFAAELQRIPVIAGEPMMAAVRLQWWRDQLSAIALPDGSGGLSGHRLFDALAEVITAYQLPVGLLQGMIDAAEIELDPTPFADGRETRQALTKFDGALFELAARVMGGGQDVPREVWGDAGLAYGAARLAVEARARHEAGAQMYVVREVADDSGRAAEVLSAQARSALAEVSAQYRLLDRATRRALLPLSTVQPLLRAVAMRSQQTLGIQSEPSRFARVLALLVAHWRGRV